MPVSSLEGILPALAIQLQAGSKLEGGTASVNATITGPANNPVIVGSVGMNGTKLTGFDLGAQVSTIERIAGIQPSRDTTIQTLSASLRSDPGGTAIQDLKFIVPSLGELDGAGTISPQDALDFKMTMTLQAPGVMAVALGKNMQIPFFIGNIESSRIPAGCGGHGQIAGREIGAWHQNRRNRRRSDSAGNFWRQEKVVSVCDRAGIRVPRRWRGCAKASPAPESDRPCHLPEPGGRRRWQLPAKRIAVV